MKVVADHLAAITEVCAAHDVGTVLRRNGDLVLAPGPRAA
jgi:hypothetical protein